MRDLNNIGCLGSYFLAGFNGYFVAFLNLLQGDLPLLFGGNLLLDILLIGDSV